MMLDDDEEMGQWQAYNQHVVDMLTDDQLLEYFGIQGPGPPDQLLMTSVMIPGPPPPPVMTSELGGGDRCLLLSSPQDTCTSLSKVGGSESVEDSPYSGMNVLSVIVAVSCVFILIACITVFLIWKRRQKKSRLSHLQYRLSDSGNFDYFPTSRRMNKYYSDHSIRNQMEDSGVFYTSSLQHPLYEEIPTPVSAESHYAVSGEYQLLNSDYSTTLPYNDATIPYSESIPFLHGNLISSAALQQQHQTNSRHSRTDAKRNGGKSQKTLPPIIKSAGHQFVGGGAKTCDIVKTRENGGGGMTAAWGQESVAAAQQMWPRGAANTTSRWLNGGSTAGRMQTLDPMRHHPKQQQAQHQQLESPRYQVPHHQQVAHHLPGGGDSGKLNQQTNQSDFLPREAWTDFSGGAEDDWHRKVAAASQHNPRDLGEGRLYQYSKNTLDCPLAIIRDRGGGGGGLDPGSWGEGGCWGDARRGGGDGSGESREISPTMNSLESSDVTISTNSSSDTYPKCLNNPGTQQPT